MTSARVRLAAAALFLCLCGCAGTKQARIAAMADPAAAQSMYDEAMRDLSARNFRKSRATLERIRFPAAERVRLEPLVRLGIADATYFLGDDASLVEARAKYLDFVLVYGDHPRAPYAQFQAGICTLAQVRVRDGTRDQSQTTLALADLAEVEKRYPESPYARAARQRIELAQANLAEHEYVVGRFYYQRKRYASATARFRRLLEDYPRYRDREKVYFYLGQSLLRMNSDAEGKIYLDKIVTDYPKGRFAPSAKRILEDVEAKERSATGGAG